MAQLPATRITSSESHKYIFTSKEWITAGETPPEGSGRRRVDLTIKYISANLNIAVLAFHEAEAPDAGPQEVRIAEEQATDACGRYLSKFTTMKHIRPYY
ncbi:hypothetical protein BJX70DRAFT_393477 [Aspergillus crustosus]